ncbi:MAG: adenosine deaminase [Pseudomonadota bacterium]
MSASLVAALPKAELHVHLEGTLEPELMWALAERNGVALPFADVTAIRAAYDFSNLQDFLDVYYAGMDVLLTQADFYDLTIAYLDRARADNVRHVELFFDPQAHIARGIALNSIMNALADATQYASSKDISLLLIPCILRHLSAADADHLYQQLTPFRGAITGIGLDSSEVDHPPVKFQSVFERAKADGLKLVAHAGEEGPPDYVYQALDVLGVDRIDHGNRAMEDAQLVSRLRDLQIPLTVCPLSNLKLNVIDDITSHPIERMLDAGLLATINSDDPAYFGGYINDNFIAVQQALALCDQQLIELAKNSFRAAFIDEAEKSRHIASIDAVTADA